MADFSNYNGSNTLHDRRIVAFFLLNRPKIRNFRHFFMTLSSNSIAHSISKLFILTCLLAVSASAKPEVVDVINGVDKPTSAVFSPGGESLYVSSSVRGQVGAYKGKSYISKFKVASDGTTKPVSKDFIGNLTAPIDMAFSTTQFPGIPKGSLFVAVGTPLVEGIEGRIIDDPSKEFVGFSIYSPKSGRLLKKIDLGPSAKIKLLGNKTVTLLASIAFDTSGNLYIGDTGIGGNLFLEKVQGRPGVWRIEKKGVEDLINGKTPKAVTFTPISSLPGPMRYVEKTNELYITANHNVGAPTGSVFKVNCDDFAKNGMAAVQTIVRGTLSISGIQITPKGRVILTTSSGDIIYPRGKKNYGTIRFRPQMSFSSPTNYGMTIMPDGSLLFAVPEQSSDVSVDHKQTVKMVYLPVKSGY